MFATSDFPGFPGGVPRSIAFWMKGKPIPPLTLDDSKLFNPPVIGWGSETSGGKWHIAIMHDGSSVGSVWGGSWRTFNMEDGFSLLDDSWHHVASVFTGRHDRGGAPEIIHYLNGQRIEPSSGILRDQVNTDASGLPGTRLFVGSASRSSAALPASAPASKGSESRSKWVSQRPHTKLFFKSLKDVKPPSLHGWQLPEAAAIFSPVNLELSDRFGMMYLHD